MRVVADAREWANGDGVAEGGERCLVRRGGAADFPQRLGMQLSILRDNEPRRFNPMEQAHDVL